MARRVVFIPWDQAVGSEFGDEVDDHNANTDRHHQHNYEAVYYDSPHPNGVIETLPWGVRIEIVGHGGRGDHELETSGGNALTYKEVADRLIEHGLKKRHPRTISLNTCSSAVPTLGSQSFAAKFANYMRSEGYLLISVLGYFGAIDGKYYMEPGHDYSHRFVTVAGKEVKGKWVAWRF
ncbi:MAG TPA: C80 family cysteine peptidase [Acidobacteriaceae bacterium]|jgi:hypothetical protein|nr:C80 family cysteine peptidase [Acidobacteriaceae bacterium]